MKLQESPHRIHVLSPATVNQIAAGEVVERHASVVKEIVENAIDAGARSIRIEITSASGAIGSIRVTDDGYGMSAADALLAFTPHATSKIATIEDLHTVRTLGFRGEALASIAAVAKVILVSKPRDSGAAAGIRIVIAGGAVQETAEVGAPEGTSVEVGDLFFNTPARKRFQKSLNTEITRIHAIMEGICLAHPGISFRLFHNKAEQLVTDHTSQALDTIARLYGSETANTLIPVESALPFMAISGYISRPSLSRKDTRRIFVAVNGRYVSSILVTNAAKEGYATLLPKDRFPVAFLDLEIDTALVDVNVHPTKKQVRLSREKEIAQAVRDAISTALMIHDLIPDVKKPARLPAQEPTLTGVQETTRSYDLTGPEPTGVSEPTHAGTALSDRRLRQTELVTGLLPVSPAIPPMEVIGQFGGIYILATTGSGELMLIDQHAAHERILYEQVTRRSGAEHRSQELIVPAILHRSPKDAAILRELMPALAEEGVVIEDFGSDAFVVRAIPVVLGKFEGNRIIDDLVSDLVTSEPARTVTDREKITRILACRGAIKAGTVCTQEQCQRIVNQLRFTKNPFTCPHGRPTMIRFSRADLDAMFKRT
ncbi:MAG: DNA mismatch repair endonuclease MutL [Methanoregula sp.]|nr:DNA mismatch repair endonuclease MutL [Methanoregula sp.]